jgi:hypothetical protein
VPLTTLRLGGVTRDLALCSLSRLSCEHLITCLSLSYRGRRTGSPTPNYQGERTDLVRGYQFNRGEYVQVTDAELNTEAQFIPIERVDPVCHGR